MEAHDGRVTLESMEGEYSRFTLVFPPESAMDDKKRNNNMEGQIIKLLLVEDDANLCYIIQGAWRI